MMMSRETKLFIYIYIYIWWTYFLMRWYAKKIGTTSNNDRCPDDAKNAINQQCIRFSIWKHFFWFKPNTKVLSNWCCILLSAIVYQSKLNCSAKSRKKNNISDRCKINQMKMKRMHTRDNRLEWFVGAVSILISMSQKQFWKKKQLRKFLSMAKFTDRTKNSFDDVGFKHNACAHLYMLRR